MSENNDSIQLQPARYDEEEKYLLRTAREIGLVLQSLIDKRALISAYISPRNHTFPTALISVLPDEGSLLIDGSANDAINRGVTHAHHLTCVSQLDRIHVQFRLTGLSPILFEGQVAFRADIPDRVLKLQRREFYRVLAPVSRTVQCIVPVEAGSKYSCVETRVYDIGLGGVAIIAQPGQIPALAGTRHENCRIVLPDAGNVVVTLEVRSTFEMKLLNGKSAIRIGCQFVRLSPASSSLIQRYTMRMERDRKRRE